jgi:hypoxanthine phosphoribosyltransferase
MSADHKDEYARSSPDTRGLRVAKEQLYADGFPVEKTRAVAAQYFQPEKFAHLRDQPDLTLLVAPTTTGQNTLPLAFAQLLQKEYGGQILTNWATPNASQRTATMDGITKMRNAPSYTINREVSATIKPDATLVLVDDVVTTGGSIAAMREALAREGKRIEQVTSLAQSDMRKVRDADIDRIVTKLGDPSLRPDVALALDGRLKHFSNYIETSIRKTDADRNAEISSYFKTEAARLRELSRTDAGAVLGIGERIARLENVQSRESTRSDVSPGLSRESRDVRPSQDRRQNDAELKQPVVTVLSLDSGEHAQVGHETRNGHIKHSVVGGHTREGLPLVPHHSDRANTTEALLTRLDALREEYAEKPDREKTEEAREIATERGGPDVTRIPLAVAAQEYVEGHTSRATLELMAEQNDQAREAREQNQSHTSEVSRDDERSISDDR